MLFGHLLRQQDAGVVGAGAGLVDGPIQQDLRHQVRPQVGPAGLQVGRTPPQPGAALATSSFSGPQLVQEQDEDPRWPGLMYVSGWRSQTRHSS